ncbi:MAG: hypothetical protein V1875_03890 [Candidatus Altiarchaeota archaeon]
MPAVKNLDRHHIERIEVAKKGEGFETVVHLNRKAVDDGIVGHLALHESIGLGDKTRHIGTGAARAIRRKLKQGGSELEIEAAKRLQAAIDIHESGTAFSRDGEVRRLGNIRFLLHGQEVRGFHEYEREEFGKSQVLMRRADILAGITESTGTVDRLQEEIRKVDGIWRRPGLDAAARLSLIRDALDPKDIPAMRGDRPAGEELIAIRAHLDEQHTHAMRQRDDAVSHLRETEGHEDVEQHNARAQARSLSWAGRRSARDRLELAKVSEFPWNPLRFPKNYSLYGMMDSWDTLNTGLLGRGIKEKKMLELLRKHLPDMVRCATAEPYGALLYNTWSAVDILWKNGIKNKVKADEDLANSLAGKMKNLIIERVCREGYAREFAESLWEPWGHVGSNTDEKNRGLFISRNVDMLSKLRHADPDADPPIAVVLNSSPYGLTNFAKYTFDSHLAQYNLHDKKNIPCILTVTGQGDHNMALTNSPDWQPGEQILRQLPRSVITRAIEVKTPEEMIEKVVEFKKMFPNVLLTVVSAHSSPDTMAFVSSAEGRLEREDIDKHPERRAGLSLLKASLPRYDSAKWHVGMPVGYSGDIPDKPIIIIQGCKSGAPGGIGQKLSHALDAIVIAPDENSGIKEVELKNEHGMLYPKVKYSKAKTRVYVSGREIPAKDLQKHLKHDYSHVA